MSGESLPCAPAPGAALGIYVHIPFCLLRCSYCDFNAYAGMEEARPPYVEALKKEISAHSGMGRVGTIFFGGGTPTELPPSQLRGILQAVRGAFDVAADAEVSIEANPETVSAEVFCDLREAGFNRVSIGVQSLLPGVLEWLGRAHGPGRAVSALREAREGGFENVNADLIFGSPAEGRGDWRISLEGVLEAGVDHLSAYALTVEEGTPLHMQVVQGRRDRPDDDDLAEKYEEAGRIMASAGLERYEISNWAKPGFWCRHNAGYWSGADYLGFGAGAHSFVESCGEMPARRWWNVKLPSDYSSRSPEAEEGHEELDASQRAAEAAMLGIRLAGGLDRGVFASRYGCDPVDRWGAELEGARQAGLVEVDSKRVRLAPGGFFMAGAVARSFL